MSNGLRIRAPLTIITEIVVVAETPPSGCLSQLLKHLPLWLLGHTFWTFLEVVTIQNHFETKSLAVGFPTNQRDAAAKTLIFKYHYACCIIQNQYIK